MTDLPVYIYILQFIAGLFLANGVPHFVQGICGHPFQSPFATPRGVGESSPVINVLWGWLNLLVGAWMLWQFWPKGGSTLPQWGLVWLGALVMALFLANHFGKVCSPKR